MPGMAAPAEAVQSDLTHAWMGKYACAVDYTSVKRLKTLFPAVMNVQGNKT